MGHRGSTGEPTWRVDPAKPPYLPAQVTEANVQLVLLAGLPLVSAAVFCMDKEAEEQSGGKGQETHTHTCPQSKALVGA